MLTSTTSFLSFTEHGHLRKNQRCKRDDLVLRLLEHFDRDIYLRDGKWAWSISRSRCKELQKAGLISPADAERLPGLVIVSADDTGVVVTLVRGNGRRLGQYLSRH
jgi:hypothetical protein